YKELCGAGVAYKLITALYRAFSREEGEEWPYLAFAAFATIGDIVDLTGENRIIVKEGLKRLQHTDHAGLKALCLACGMETRQIDPYRIGFVLGPCINAGGRLDSAMLPYELMSTEDPERAAEIALALKELNDSRKALTDEAEEKAAAELMKGGCGEKVYVIFLPECHESIAGIVAGRIREKYDHPTYILTRSGEFVKGSGRSVSRYSMFEELAGCSDLLVKFGGHPMAAGLTLREENIGALRRMLNDRCSLKEEDFFTKVQIDAAMPLRYVSEELISQLALLAPFGKANPEPLFAQKGIRAENPRLLGAKKNVLKMRLRSADGTAMDGICFRDAEEHYREVQENPGIMVAYVPAVNEFNGMRSLQAEIRYLRIE
ncbi:MAG: single-stranded-DNA-specific exonuclease RecJ, partial [Lachnospiraceae bacterium]|nr:single-stranded-DNA-specific exonuclease RecJ [Lachnospiraceae bacterium]